MIFTGQAYNAGQPVLTLVRSIIFYYHAVSRFSVEGWPSLRDAMTDCSDCLAEHSQGANYECALGATRFVMIDESPQYFQF